MRILTFGAIVGLLAACGSGDAPAGPVDQVLPSYSGALVEKFREPFILFPDNETNRVFSLGLVTPIEEACAGAELVFDTNEREFFTTTPQGVTHMMVHAGPSTLVIYGRAPADACELTAADILVQGTGQFKIGANDQFVTSDGATAFGYRIEGSGTVPTGERVRVRVELHVVFTPSGHHKILLDSFELIPFGR